MYTHHNESKYNLLKPVSDRLVKQLKAEVSKLEVWRENALKDYSANIESGIDHSDYIFYSYQDKIDWVKSFIDEQYEHYNNYTHWGQEVWNDFKQK